MILEVDERPNFASLVECEHVSDSQFSFSKIHNIATEI